ncbi:sigma-70 family RNA polymerase sigma factor [Hoyosella sp. YIM 151337]|uniref:RNA polymerase sigma factor n=1 Tax=Hoyosella sp. YIM 151337 TaxID=2992742 RepID=UPI0022360FEC|nr:sigma-70 family RNA polymerase sigma factor [Hoyosella sp. YIM 151337]MCW4352925.1 sigma-70 family RNA polymerase sigma factor [Hoyosella sp. YIM 151337]
MDEETATRERGLVEALRNGDEQAFAALVDELTPMMLKVARGYVANREAAEEVVQETWIALLKGIHAFQHRALLRTWLFRVLVNIAKTRGAKDQRYRAVSFDENSPLPAVDPARFQDPEEPWPGHWRSTPKAWDESPEHSLLASEIREVTQQELDRLPEAQRDVVTLRDVMGYEASEVCEMLAISAANQRVLLHRGRARIRQALEQYMGARDG